MNTSLKLTRGERNKNPGNLEQSANKWQGRVENPTDPRFEQFVDVQWGIRALAKVLFSYHKKGFNTITKIISRYAPSSENDTTAYISSVCATTGVGAEEVFPIRDSESLYKLVKAIIKHENGRVIYEDSEIKKAVELAL